MTARYVVAFGVCISCGGRLLPEDAKASGGDAVVMKPDAPIAAATSCADVLANGNTQSGEYDIVENGQPLTVYCDMTIGGGGFTAFFSSTVGDAFAHFEASLDVCPKPATECLRHLPPTIDTSHTFAVSCGADAVLFQLNVSTLDFFAKGTQHQWQSLTNVELGAGNPQLGYATKVWTGSGANQGWIVSDDDNEPSFTPHTFASAYDFNQTWNYCNGSPSTTAVVRLLYR